MSTLKAVRGTRDLLPPETALWNRIESTARSVFARYNFGEIRTPVFEDTGLYREGAAKKPTSSRRKCTPGKIAPAPHRRRRSR
jgi:histidyl-tRNA synthetase